MPAVARRLPTMRQHLPPSPARTPEPCRQPRTCARESPPGHEEPEHSPLRPANPNARATNTWANLGTSSPERRVGAGVRPCWWCPTSCDVQPGCQPADGWGHRGLSGAGGGCTGGAILAGRRDGCLLRCRASCRPSRRRGCGGVFRSSRWSGGDGVGCFLSLIPRSAQLSRHRWEPVGRPVVGQDALDGDTAFGEPGHGPVEHCDRGEGLLVVVALGVGEPGVVVDHGVHEAGADLGLVLAGLRSRCDPGWLGGSPSPVRCRRTASRRCRGCCRTW